MTSTIFLPQALQHPFRAVLFDLDGTLVDSEHIHYAAFRQAMKEQGLDFDQLVDKIEYHGSFRDLFREIAQLLKLDEGEFDNIYERKMELTLELHAGNVDAVEGVHSFLELLHENQVPMGVVTNADRTYAEHALRSHGLAHYFNHITTAQDVAASKPAPDGYLLGAEMLQLKPADILVFENSDAGIAAAKAAGMRVVAITTTDAKGFSNYEQADLTIPDFTDPTIDDLQFHESRTV